MGFPYSIVLPDKYGRRELEGGAYRLVTPEVKNHAPKPIKIRAQILNTIRGTFPVHHFRDLNVPRERNSLHIKSQGQCTTARRTTPMTPNRAAPVINAAPMVIHHT